MAEIDFAAILAEDKPAIVAPAAAAIAPTSDVKQEVELPETEAEPGAASGDEPPATETPAPSQDGKVVPRERLNSEIAKRREQKTRADKAEAERDALIARLTQAPPTGDPFDPSKFATLEERDNAIREQARKDALAEVRTNEAKKQVDGFWTKLEKDGKDIEDFDDVVEGIRSKDFPISPAMAGYILKAADHTALLAKWLVDNKAETERIYALEPEQAVKELSRRDALLGRSVKPVTKAPPVLTPVAPGAASAPQSFERMSHDDLKKWAKEQERR